ncbi:MAG TPA: FAD-binding oxidoreductase [Thermohalobaculum sp.]|nr:FAD-binding oxidoreductase [Thermohalobaculum sp.]
MSKVTRLPRDPGPAAWNALLPPAPPARVLESHVTADWLVIGGGWAGLAAARRLSQLRGGDRIVVLEASRIGEGPNGRNSGFMIDLPHDIAADSYAGAVEADRQQTRMNRAAIAFNAEAAAEYGMSAEAFAPVGKINAAATDKGMAKNAAYARHLSALGEPCRVLDAADMKALTGIHYYRGGVHTPGAAMVQPAMFVRALAEGLAPVVDIREASPVTDLTRTGTDWRATTPKGSVTAPRVILAVNGHAESFGYFRRQLMHVFTYASMTRALTADEVARLGGEPRWGVLPADPMGTTVRRISGTGGDRVIVRNRFTYDPGMEVGDARLRAVARDHDASFAARFPMLKGVEMAYRWGGRLCLSWNGVPAFGEVEPGLFAACCQNGLGTSKGTLAGMLAAELAAQGNDPMVAQMLAMAAPRRLPPEPFAWIGANATIRWEEWNAGREK